VSSTGRTVERFRVARRDPSLAVLEGFHALKHAFRFGADVLEGWTADTASLRRLAMELAPDAADSILGLARETDATSYEELSPSAHPTGVIAIARRPAVSVESVLAAPGAAAVVLLERPTHHGNIGAVVRVAAAAGAAGVLVTGSHDPWHPASVRGGAGLQFALPVMSLDEHGLEGVVGCDRPLVALDPDGEPLTRSGDGPAALPDRAVLVFGSERSGVSPALLDRVDRRVSIPMRPGVSSLNLATAVAIALYAGRLAGS
jgi:TrmH family RNA methyltransferase